MKFWRRYFLLATAVVSITFTAAGIVAVDENARRISMGETQIVVVCGTQARVNGPAEVTDIEPQIKELIRIATETKNRIVHFLHNAV